LRLLFGGGRDTNYSFALGAGSILRSIVQKDGIRLTRLNYLDVNTTGEKGEYQDG